MDKHDDAKEIKKPRRRVNINNRLFGLALKDAVDSTRTIPFNGSESLISSSCRGLSPLKIEGRGSYKAALANLLMNMEGKNSISSSNNSGDISNSESVGDASKHNLSSACNTNSQISEHVIDTSKTQFISENFSVASKSENDISYPLDNYKRDDQSCSDLIANKERNHRSSTSSHNSWENGDPIKNKEKSYKNELLNYSEKQNKFSDHRQYKKSNSYDDSDLKYRKNRESNKSFNHDDFDSKYRKNREHNKSYSHYDTDSKFKKYDEKTILKEASKIHSPVKIKQDIWASDRKYARSVSQNGSDSRFENNSNISYIHESSNRTLKNSNNDKISDEDKFENNEAILKYNRNDAQDFIENEIILNTENHQRKISDLEAFNENGKFRCKGKITFFVQPELSSDLNNTDKLNTIKSCEEKIEKELGDFIPPPTEVDSFNASDCNFQTDEFGNTNYSKENADPDALSTNDSYSSIQELSPDHLEAITNFILKEVKERSVNLSIADKVIYDLNSLFKLYLQGNVIDVYGSYATNLATTFSNINIVMKPTTEIKKSFMQTIRNVLSENLKDYSVQPFEESNHVTDIRITFAEPKEGITCQLAYLGKRQENILKLQKLLKDYCMLDKRVKKLIIAAKIWAEICQINEVEDGKLHNIGFTLMMIHFLQHCDKPVLPFDQDLSHEISNSSIGELWLGFLKYFGLTFNWEQNVVTINSKEPVLKKSLDFENYWMAIEDPYSHKNIARSVINLDVAEHIKMCFKASYEYFANPPMNSSNDNSTDEDSLNIENDKYKFSFQECLINLSEENLNNFCEECDELDDMCDNCKQKNYKPPMAAVPKMTDRFLKIIGETLHNILEKYVLTPDEVEQRKEFIKDLKVKIRKSTVYRDVELALFGSSVNGFGFKSSDLDICMIFKSEEHKNPLVVLKTLRTILRRDPDFDDVLGIFNATVPVLKFHYIPKNWRGDISLSNILAIHNSQLLHTYSMIDKRCVILGCCLKFLAQKAIISGTVDKGLSSYSYLIMVIHFLQQTDPPILPVLQDPSLRNDYSLDYVVEGCNTWFCKDLDYIKKICSIKNETPVEQLWLDLLDYYCKFDINHRFISIRQKEPLYLGETQKRARLFNIEDPFIVTKNLGCSVDDKMAETMLKVFQRAWKLFKTPREDIPRGVENYEQLFFSSMSLRGKIIKESHCDTCGKYGHEKKECKHNNFAFNTKGNRLFSVKYKYSKRNNFNKKLYKKP